jgi:hypothetical protein
MDLAVFGHAVGPSGEGFPTLYGINRPGVILSRTAPW